MAGSTLEELKARWAPARKAARNREDRLLQEKYSGQYVASTDERNGEELVRTVVAVAAQPAEFQKLVAALEPETRRRARPEAVPAPGTDPFPFA